MSEPVSVAAFMRPRLATALGVTPELVTDDLELATLGLSSLEIMEIVYDAEDELGIVFPEESLESAHDRRRADHRARRRSAAAAAKGAS